MWSKLNVRSALERLGDVVAPPVDDEDDDDEDDDNVDEVLEDHEEDEYDDEDGDDDDEEEPGSRGMSGPFGLVGMLTRALDNEQQQHHHQQTSQFFYEISNNNHNNEMDEPQYNEEQDQRQQYSNDYFRMDSTTNAGGLGHEITQHEDENIMRMQQNEHEQQPTTADNQYNNHNNAIHQQQYQQQLGGYPPVAAVDNFMDSKNHVVSQQQHFSMEDDWDDEIYVDDEEVEEGQQPEQMNHTTVMSSEEQDDIAMKDVPMDDKVHHHQQRSNILHQQYQQSSLDEAAAIAPAVSNHSMGHSTTLLVDEIKSSPSILGVIQNMETMATRNTSNNYIDDNNNSTPNSNKQYQETDDDNDNNEQYDDNDLCPSARRHSASINAVLPQQTLIREKGSVSPHYMPPIKLTSSASFASLKISLGSVDNSSTDSMDNLMMDETTRGSPQRRRFEDTSNNNDNRYDHNNSTNEIVLATTTTASSLLSSNFTIPNEVTTMMKNSPTTNTHNTGNQSIGTPTITAPYNDDESVVSPLSKRKEFLRPPPTNTNKVPSPTPTSVGSNKSPDRQTQQQEQQKESVVQSRRTNPPARARKHQHKTGGPPRADSLLFLDNMKNETSAVEATEGNKHYPSELPNAVTENVASHQDESIAYANTANPKATSLLNHEEEDPEPTTDDKPSSATMTHGNDSKSREQKRYRRRPGPPKADSMLFLQPVPPKDMVSNAEEDDTVSQQQVQFHGRIDAPHQQEHRESSVTLVRMQELEETNRQLQLKLSQAETHIVSMQQQAASQMEKEEAEHNLLIKKFQEKETFMFKTMAEDHQYEKELIQKELSQTIEELQAKMNVEMASYHREKDRLERLLREANHKIEMVEKDAQNKLKKADAASAQSHQQQDRALRMAEDKLAQAKAKIDERDEQMQNLKTKIHSLESKMSEQVAGVREAEDELEELHNENDSLRRHAEEMEQECVLLRSQLSDVQADVDSIGSLKMELHLLKEERERDKAKTESVVASAESTTTHLENQRDEALAQANDLRQQLAAAVADVQVMRTDMNRVLMSNANLQNALEAFQTEREAELAMMEDQRLASEQGSAAAHTAAMEATYEAHKAEMAQLQHEADTKLRESLEATKRLEHKLEQYRADNMQMRRSLDEAIRRLQTTQEDVIDRSLMKNILLDWLTKTGPKERGHVLEIMASVLHFSDEEKEKVHIHGGSLSFGQVVGAIAAPLPASKADMEHLEGNTVQEKWLNFLLAETDD